MNLLLRDDRPLLTIIYYHHRVGGGREEPSTIWGELGGIDETLVGLRASLELERRALVEADLTTKHQATGSGEGCGLVMARRFVTANLAVLSTRD